MLFVLFLHIIIYINYIYIHTYINSYSIDRCPHNFSCSRAEFVTPPPKKLKKNTSSLLPYSARILPTFMIHRYISPSLYYIHIIYIQTYIYPKIFYIYTRLVCVIEPFSLAAPVCTLYITPDTIIY